MIHSDVTPQLVYQILNAPIREHPFPHFFTQNIFPQTLYNEILNHMPDDIEYQTLLDQGYVYTSPQKEEAYKHRDTIMLNPTDLQIKDKKKRLFWQDLTTVITSPEFIVPITLKFKQPLLTRFGENANIKYKILIDLLRDTEMWALGPHTDHPDKIMVILIYLPSNNLTPYLGTSLYTPKEHGFTCEGGPHHSREHFNCCATLPFLPNSAFGFCKNNVSFHGVESVKKVGDVRNLIQISVLKEDSILL